MTFKVGDRVAAYWYDGRFTGKIAELEKHGARIYFDSGQIRRCHFKQLRRLKPKKRREFYVLRELVDGIFATNCGLESISTLTPHPDCAHRWVKVKEIAAQKPVISKE